MRKTLLFAAMLIASVFTAKSQLTLSGSVETVPRTDWAADEVTYDMERVATALGFLDAAALDDALWDFVTGASTEIQVYNISKNGNETSTNTGNAAYYWHWSTQISEWYLVTKGCFWLDSNNEEVGWTTPAMMWTHVNWNSADNALLIGMGQNGYYNNGSGLPAGEYTATTKLVHGSSYVTLYSTLIVKAPDGLPFEPVTEIDQLDIVSEQKIEVEQPVMLDWATTADQNPAWSVDAKELLKALPEFDLALINSNMAKVYWCRDWDAVADELSNTLSNQHDANAHGFWMKHTVDGETGETTDYCVPNGWTGSEDFFTENIVFNPEDSTFTGDSGQNPYRNFKGGEHFWADFYFVLGEKAIHVEFHFNVKKDKEYTFDEMEKVGERTITWVQEPRTDTSGLKKWIPDYDEILALLGCNENGVRFKLLQPDRTIVSETNTGNNGFWIDEAGYGISPTGEQLAFYVDYTQDLMALSVGQYPNLATAGDEFTATLMLCHEEKYYQINVILSIQDQTKASTEDYHEVAQYTYTLRTLIDATWDCTEHQTPGLDMEAIEEVLGTSDFVVYAHPGDTWTTGYTCTPYPGFWFTPEGEVVWWNGGAYIGMVFERNYLLTFKNPNQEVSVGDTFTHSMYLVNEVTGAYVTLTVRMTYVDEIVNYENVGEAAVTINVDPTIDYGWGNTLFDATAMYAALGTDEDDFFHGSVKALVNMGDDNYVSFDTDIMTCEYFFDADGKGLEGDGSEASFQIDYELDELNVINILANVYDFDAEDTSGQERTTTLCFQKQAKRYFLTVRVFYGEEDAIEAVGADSRHAADTYTLAGQRVGAPVRGLYIIDGKKTLVK